MIRQLKALVVLAALAIGAWYVWQNYDLTKLTDFKLAPLSGALGEVTREPPPVNRTGDTIRIASYNLQVFGESKLEKPEVVDTIAEVIRRFDIVAVQEIRAVSQDVLPQLIARVNATGRHYDFLLGPRLGRSNSKEQYAFIFDAASIEVDRTSIYTINDPDDRLHREPLVAGFRVRGPPTDQAFTFTLINVHTDPDEVAVEVNALDDVFRAVLGDGRNEDDLILLGDFNADESQMGELIRVAHLTHAIYGMPSNTLGTQLYDNLLFHQRATVEYTGMAGVFDLSREYRLSQEQALAISDHFPVWAEFSIYEGGHAARVARAPGR